MRDIRLSASALPRPCEVGELVVEEPAGQRAAEHDDAHADQPGLDDRDGSERAVGDSALDTISGENTSREKSLRPSSPFMVATAPGSRVARAMRPPSRSRWDHQKDWVPISTLTTPRAKDSRHRGVIADRRRTSPPA
ncbi:hypothetical protein K7B10_00465 [Streptomyces flavotricini]|uniref:Uncharacterized protein n=1 Tax=Streptomyces flavotricini TaxID=66888 RepID=A0ABS8DXC3_9ACTN|nr:hypothetical protein [Streptomyces flavotricini]